MWSVGGKDVVRGIAKWDGPLPAPCVRTSGGLWRCGRFAVSIGGLAAVGGLVALSASGLWVEAPLYRWVVALPSLVVLLQLATHEAGHALAAIFRGYSVETVFVTAPAAGVVPARSSRDIDPRDFLWIALWGPLANLVAGALAVLVGFVWGWSLFLVVFVTLQIGGCVLNAVPFQVREVSRAVTVSWPALGLVGAASDGYYAKLMLRGPSK